MNDKSEPQDRPFSYIIDTYTTLALVLDRSDSASADPVNTFGEFFLLLFVLFLGLIGVGGGLIVDISSGKLRLRGPLSTSNGIHTGAVLAKIVEIVELIVGHVRKSIVTNSVRRLRNLTIVLLDEF